MKEQQKQAERKRLHGLLFADAPEWAEWVAMDGDSDVWNYHGSKAFENGGGWHFWRAVDKHFSICKAQPETTLDWKDTLIRRGEYE